MKKLTQSQQDIIDKFRELPFTELRLDTPFHIARRAPSWWAWEHYEKEEIETQYIQGYARAADGLVQRGLLIRDKGAVRFWLTLFGLSYIKEL